MKEKERVLWKYAPGGANLNYGVREDFFGGNDLLLKPKGQVGINQT